MPLIHLLPLLTSILAMSCCWPPALGRVLGGAVIGSTQSCFSVTEPAMCFIMTIELGMHDRWACDVDVQVKLGGFGEPEFSLIQVRFDAEHHRLEYHDRIDARTTDQFGALVYAKALQAIARPPHAEKLTEMRRRALDRPTEVGSDFLHGRML